MLDTLILYLVLHYYIIEYNKGAMKMAHIGHITDIYKDKVSLTDKLSNLDIKPFMTDILETNDKVFYILWVLEDQFGEKELDCYRTEDPDDYKLRIAINRCGSEDMAYKVDFPDSIFRKKEESVKDIWEHIEELFFEGGDDLKNYHDFIVWKNKQQVKELENADIDVLLEKNKNGIVDFTW